MAGVYINPARQLCDLPREKTNVDQGKESNYHARTDNQHSQRRSIKKARPRLNRRLDNMSTFLV